MHQIFEKNLISTKDAGELSGYTSDYLARLARSGKIIGRRIGHSWFVDKESLSTFISQQGDRKVDYARALARAREKEYQALNAPRTPIQHVADTLTKPLQVSGKISSFAISFGSHAIASAAAVLVIGSGIYMAQAAPIEKIATEISSIAYDASSGFSATFGNIPARIAEEINTTSEKTRSHVARVAKNNNTLTSRLAFDFPSARIPSFENSGVKQEIKLPQTQRKSDFQNPVTITFDVQKIIADIFAFASSPANVLTDNYFAFGNVGYNALQNSLVAYDKLIRTVGESTLSLATDARDTLSRAPQFITQMNLAIGNGVIAMTHAVIGAEVSTAYRLSETLPATGRAVIALTVNTGDALASVAERTPNSVKVAFLRATEAPARLGPAIAKAVFDAEYAGASRFVAASNAVSGHYLALIKDTSSLASSAVSFIAAAPSVFENAYLGVLGKSALAFEAFARTPKVAAALTAINTATAPMLAAVQPTLTVGQEIAVTTYRTINNWFSSATNALASLVAPPPTIVMPTSTRPTARVAESLKTSETNSYTTIVQSKGVSEDFVNQSLASLRTGILATVVGMIQPVSNQAATNVTTIQQVNMIQDLSNLIVRNGDFRGGTMTSGLSVAATTGEFTNLTGTNFNSTSATTTNLVATSATVTTLTSGTASLATTTITGDLTVSGTITPAVISAGTSIAAPYFTATSTTATSTFAGRFAVGTTSPYGDGWFTVGTSTPLLAISSSTGNVGIGTTTPKTIFHIAGTDGLIIPVGTTAQRPSSLATGIIRYNSETAQFEGYGSSSWGSLGGVIDVDQDTQITAENSAGADNDQLKFLTAGTERMRIDSNGLIGIGTTTPYSLLSLSNSATTAANTPLFTVASTTAGTATSTLMTILASGRVGIGTAAPDASATLDITSTTGGILPPRLTTVQKNAIASPTAGLTLYDSTLNKLNVYNGSAWKNVGSTEIGGEVTSGALGSVLFIGDGTVLGQDSAFNYSTSTGRFGVGYASTTQLSAYGSVVVGGTSTTTIAGDGNTSTIYGPLAVRGTASQASSLTLQRGNNGNNTIAFNDQVGTSLMRIYTDANTGYARIVGDQSYLTLGTLAGGATVTIDSSSNVNVAGHVLPTANQTYNLGSPAVYWSNSYINNVVANNLSSASTSIAGTNNTSFSINSNNPTSDTQDISLIFYRGAGAPSNAVLSWNSALKRFEFNQNAYIANATASIASTTLLVKGVLGQTAPLTDWQDSLGNSLVSISAAGLLSAASVSFTNPILGYASSTQLTVSNSTYLATTGGNVGIGTTNPVTKFTVDGGNSNGFGLRVRDTADLTYRGDMYTYAGQGVLINSYKDAPSAGYQKMQIDASPLLLNSNSNGNVGIGTTGPSKKLDVAGDVRLGSAAASPIISSVHGVFFQIDTDNDATNQAFEIRKDGSAFNDGTLLLRVQEDGNVGIGTTTPQAKLTVSGTGAANQLLITDTGGAANGHYGGIGFSNGGFNFDTLSDALATTTRVVINSSGNVGIGTAAPANKLDVSADNAKLRIADTVVSGTGSTVTLELSTGGAYGSFANPKNMDISFNGYGSENAKIRSFNAALDNDTGGLGFFTATDYGTPATEKVRIMPRGNVGIGTTNPQDNLHIITGSTQGMTMAGDSPRILFDDNVGAAQDNFQIRNDGAYAYFSDATDGVDIMVMGLGYGGSSGKVGISTSSPWGLLSINANGIAAGAPQFVIGSSTRTDLIVTQSGNVGIGTTAPNYKLEVNGSASTTLLYLPNTTNANTGVIYKGANTFIHNYAAAGSDERNTFVGLYAGNFTMGPGGSSSYFGSNNTALGFSAIQSNTTGFRNTGIGSYALQVNTTGSANTAVGYLTLAVNSIGDYNTALGYMALTANTEGLRNTAVGYNSLPLNTTGNRNTAVGFYGLQNNVTGSNNVALGYSAGAYETGSNAFYVDNQDRTNTAGDKAGALLYGTFNATPANQTLTINASTTVAQNLMVLGTGNSYFAGNVGIGTATPGSTGMAKLALHGTTASTAGPHLQFTTTEDAYPLMQIGPWTHDTMWIAFDAYYDGSNWKSSDAGSNFKISKGGDKLLFSKEVMTVGNNITWDDAMAMDTNGNVGIGTASPGDKLDVRDGDIVLSGTNVAHGMTTLTTTEIGGHISTNTNNGGINIWGLSDTDAVPVYISGFVGSTNPTVAAIEIAGTKKNGTSYQALAATEAVLKVYNNIGGTALLTILGGGNVGIGTTSPWGLLSVNANGLTAGSPQFVIGSSTRTDMIVTQNGNVGIGTTTPFATLSVAGSGFFNSNLTAANITATGTLTATSASIGSLSGLIAGNSGTLYSVASSSLFGFTPQTNQLAKGNFLVGNDAGVAQATSTLFISSTGFLGLGTTTPQWPLQVSNATLPQLALGDSSLTSNKWTFRSIGSSLYIATSSPLTYATSSMSALTINANGYIGIGTTSPNANLSIQGSIGVNSSQLYLAATGNIGIGTTTPASVLNIAGVSPKLYLTNNSGGTDAKHWFLSNTSGDFSIGTTSDSLASNTSYFTVASSTGYVGIGTSVPSYMLDVSGSAAIGGGTESMRIDTTGYVGIGTSSPYAMLSILNNTANLVDLFAIATSTSGIVFKVDSYGRTYGDGAYASPAADYAEYFRTQSIGLTSGEVVCIDPVENNSVKRCERGADNNVMGIVSTKPSVIGNFTKAAEADPAHHVIVGMLGQVDAFVSAENGAINVGDSLTSASSTAGYAMRADGGDSTVGIALEPLPSDKGVIKVLISRRNKSLAVEEVEALVVERIANMKIEDSVAQMIEKAIDDITLEQLAISGTVSAGGFEATLKPVTGFTMGSTTTIAELPADVLTADKTGVSIYKLATYTLSGVQALAAKFDALDTRVTSLEARLTSLENGAISSASTAPAMDFSSTTLASALEGFGVLIQKGISQFNTLVFRQLVASKDEDGTSSAGSIVILKDSVVAEVANSMVKPSTKVFVTFNSQIKGSWWVSDKTIGSFRVVLSEAQQSDVSFDYFLVQTEGQIATSSPMTSDKLPMTNDTEAPVITLIGDNPLHLSIGGVFAEPGISVVDANQTSTVTYINGIEQEANAGTINTSSETTYIITYSVTDTAGNNATARRSVIVGTPVENPDGQTPNPDGQSPADTTPPTVTLVGDAATEITIGGTFVDPGATAMDDVDGTIAPVVTGSVDVAVAGLYTLTYTATDVAGNSASVSRVVTVVAAATPPPDAPPGP